MTTAKHSKGKPLYLAFKRETIIRGIQKGNHYTWHSKGKPLYVTFFFNTGMMLEVDESN